MDGVRVPCSGSSGPVIRGSLSSRYIINEETQRTGDETAQEVRTNYRYLRKGAISVCGVPTVQVSRQGKSPGEN